MSERTIGANEGAVERWLAWRYLATRQREGFVSFIAVFSLIGVALGVATLIVHANRSYPLYFQNAYLRSDDVTVNLPLGWKVGSVPAPINRDAKAVVYTVSAVDEKGTLHITRSLRNELVWLDKDKYGILRNFFQLVRTGDEQQVVLQPNI